MNNLDKLANLMVLTTEKQSEVITAICSIQLHGLAHRAEGKDVSSIELIKASGSSLATQYLILKTLGLAEDDIKELVAQQMLALKVGNEQLFTPPETANATAAPSTETEQ